LSLARQAVHEQQPASASGVLSIAAGLSISTYLLPDILKKYQSLHPAVRVERAVRKFLAGAENGFGLRSGSGAGTFAAASRSGNAELAG
jgi:DNA-binding transcriptional LysR family regulator